MELSSWVRRVSQGLVSWNSTRKKWQQNSEFPDLCIVINHCQVLATASNPDPDPLWPWWPRFPWLSGRSGAATTAPRSRQNSVGETVPAKKAGLDWWDWWLHDPFEGVSCCPDLKKVSLTQKKSILSIHTIPMILSKSHKQLVVSTVNVTSLILISRGNQATIEVERGKVPQLFSQSIQSPNEVLLSLLSNKEYSSWWFDTWYYDWNWQGLILIWQDHPPQADNKVREDRASMAKLARSSRAHRAMRPRCRAICDMSVTSGQRHQPRANSPLSDPLWAKHWGLSIKLWQSCFCLLQLSMLHNIPWLTAVSVHGHWNKWKDLSSFL